ncbi:MAG TPA: Ig-like domain-containing protein [Candidatus Sulfotelmatobacter sp.]|nr:Ig-like domain-containing protein [Candidatus Sulfotelmatobacter sp.]
MSLRHSSVQLPKVVYYVGLLFVLSLLSAIATGQVTVLTQHYDNARTGQNTHETILTHTNVNSAQFGKLFTRPLDGQEPAQPLYVPSVFIPSTGSVHNVVYVATMHDSVYAFDADNNQGSNASPLWMVNFLNEANGVTTVPVADENCTIAGYSEFGIQGTPVIDLSQNAIYVLAMTKENGSYVHRLHALDLGTGAELFGGPVVVTASVVVDGTSYPFIDKFQQQRPGLLLQGGNVYIGFGGPGCNIKTENGWAMAYNSTSLQQVGAFNVSPGRDASAIWQSGGGLAGDGEGDIYFSTGDGLFDGPGGTHFGDSVIKLHQDEGGLNLADYFTPYNQEYFQENDLDMSSTLVQLLPEQPDGSNFALAVDKNGTAYLLNQNELGGYNPVGDFQIAQELDMPVLGEVHNGVTYWNKTIYIAADQTPVMAYSFSNNAISSVPTSQTPKATAQSSGGIVSANGTQNGIYWYATYPTNKLFAFDATNLAHELYDSAMVSSRDALGPMVHFGMPVVADGRVYLNGKTQLSVFGLLPVLDQAAGNNQSGVVGTTLPIALKVQLTDPYSGGAITTAGVPVTFSASKGSLSNPNATTDSNGTVTTTYTLPSKPGTYTITASSSGYASTTFTETATAGTPTVITIKSGNYQSATVGTSLPSALSATVKDASGNGVPGISVSFSDGGAGGTLSPVTATTNSSGVASSNYTLGTVAQTVHVTASTAGVASISFTETARAGQPSSMVISSGNNQTVKAGQKATLQLKVLVEDQYSNAVSGVSVTYNDGGAGGSFSVNPAITSKGIAGTFYTAPTTKGTVTVTASATGVNSVQFTVNVD